MQNHEDKPEEVKTGEVLPSYQPLGRGSEQQQGTGRKSLIIGVVASVILSFLMMSLYFMPTLESKTDFTTNIQRVDKGIADLKTSVDALNVLTTQISNLSNSIGSTNSELASVRGSMAGYATQGSLSTLQTSLATIQADINTVKTSVGDIPALKTKVDGLQTSLDALNTQFTALKSKVTETEADIATLQTKVDNIVAGETSTTTGNTTTSGSITVSYFNSPMIFVKPILPTQYKSFGIKLVNGYADKDLVQINMTIKLNIANLAVFEGYGTPLLESNSGIFTWTYNGRNGNIAEFIMENDAFLNVQKNGGEFSDNQKLTLSGDPSLTGTYTVSVNSITINSKTLQ